MKSLKKRAMSLALSSALVLSFGTGAVASNEGETQAKAEALKELSLFQGSDIGFELDRGMTRMEAIIMSVRLGGYEWTALYEENDHPFTDAPTWENADKYVGYAYANGLVEGIDATTLDPNSPVDGQMYMTLVLRTLGYTDVWENWKSLSAEADIDISGLGEDEFLRGDMVDISYDALDSVIVDTEGTLSDALMNAGVFSEFALMVASAIMNDSITNNSSLSEIAGLIYSGTSEGVSTASFGVAELNSDNMQYFLGTSNIEIVEGIAIEPMMTSTAHSVSLIRLDDDADVEAVKAEILENVDPMKWICVGVDEENIRVESVGNLVLLVMDNNVSDIIAENFLALDADENEKISPDENGMMQLSDMYISESSSFKAENVEKLGDKLISVRDTYLGDAPVYYGIIPDKSFYAKDQITSFQEHDKIIETLAQVLAGWTEIDLTDSLMLSDYYNTDPHWRQDALGAVLSTMGEAMDFEIDADAFSFVEYDGFIGSYRRSVEALTGETIGIFSSSATENSVVDNYQYPNQTEVYSMELMSGDNPFDLFLNGASPLITITNPEAASERKLVIFRDSYGSSLAPLLLEAYSEITLVDLRYMASSLLPDFVDFTDKEVLFLFSDELANSNFLLK